MYRASRVLNGAGAIDCQGPWSVTSRRPLKLLWGGFQWPFFLALNTGQAMTFLDLHHLLIPTMPLSVFFEFGVRTTSGLGAPS